VRCRRLAGRDRAMYPGTEANAVARGCPLGDLLARSLLKKAASPGVFAGFVFDDLG